MKVKHVNTKTADEIREEVEERLRELKFEVAKTERLQQALAGRDRAAA